MCLSDPDTAVVIGGETADQNYCRDSLWKLELGQWREFLLSNAWKAPEYAPLIFLPLPR